MLGLYHVLKIPQVWAYCFIRRFRLDEKPWLVFIGYQEINFSLFLGSYKMQTEIAITEVVPTLDRFQEGAGYEILVSFADVRYL